MLNLDSRSVMSCAYDFPFAANTEINITADKLELKRLRKRYVTFDFVSSCMKGKFDPAKILIRYTGEESLVFFPCIIRTNGLLMLHIIDRLRQETYKITVAFIQGQRYIHVT